MHHLKVYVGPVHSGKTTNALLDAMRRERLSQRVVLLRPLRSVRPDMGETADLLRSKSGLTFPAISVDSATAAFRQAEDQRPHVYWFSEVSLFSEQEYLPRLVATARESADVIVDGLSATSELSEFGSAMGRILAVADEIESCKADCDRCFGRGTATRSHCLVQKSGPVLVGGTEKYQALCYACWNEARSNT